jgi:DNA mismatch repair ATPase MutS
VEWLVSRTRCRSLFATHYHLLVQDWEVDPRVLLGHMDCFVKQQDQNEADEEVTFLYKLCNGASPKSYGINVARLAGLPASLIELAISQSRQFEEKTNQKRFRHSHALEGDFQQEVELRDELTVGSSFAAMDSHVNKIFSIFERLISISNSQLSSEELCFVVSEIWRRFEVLNA